MARLPVPAPAPISEADYEAIEAAVMETARGRWFLSEYARRNRHSDTEAVLAAIARLERSVSHGRGDEFAERLRVDILEMSRAIARTKAEIAAIRPDAEAEGRFGAATFELDAIVDTTEAATSDILHAAEQVQEIAWTLREQGIENAACDQLDERATDIYTACSFQDLTGQRIRKVIQVLRFLEQHIDTMIDIWGVEGAAPAGDVDSRPEGRRLASGPALPGTGLEQRDVDEVMLRGAVELALADAAIETVDIEVEEIDLESFAPLALAPTPALAAGSAGGADAGGDSGAPELFDGGADAFLANDGESLRAGDVPFDLPDLRALATQMAAASRPRLTPHEVEELSPIERVALFT